MEKMGVSGGYEVHWGGAGKIRGALVVRGCRGKMGV